MDKWADSDTVLGCSISKIKIPDGYDKDGACSEGQWYAGGTGAEIETESEAEISTVVSGDEKR